MLLSLNNSVYASECEAPNSTLVQILSERLDSSIDSEIDDLLEIAEDYISIESSNLSYDEPFFIYDYENTTNNQQEIIYYPVINDVDTVVLLISAAYTENGWSFSLSEDLVDELNALPNQPSEYLYYEDDSVLVAEDSSNSYVLEGNIDEEISSFVTEDYAEKTEIITEAAKKAIENNQMVEPSENSNATEDGYTRSLSNTMVGALPVTQCTLYNSRGQGNYQICWAATVATIGNYIKGTSYTAKGICNKVGVEAVGQSITVAAKALSTIGVSGYSVQGSTESYAKIKKKY